MVSNSKGKKWSLNLLKSGFYLSRHEISDKVTHVDDPGFVMVSFVDLILIHHSLHASQINYVLLWTLGT